jgi:hypothetical protein
VGGAMSVNLHIERLVLDGLPVDARDGARVEAAVRAELVGRMAESGVPAGLKTGFNKSRILAPMLRLNSSFHAKEIGTQIGAGIYSAFEGLNHER